MFVREFCYHAMHGYFGFLHRLAIEPIPNLAHGCDFTRLSRRIALFGNCQQALAVIAIADKTKRVGPRLFLWTPSRIAGLAFLKRHCSQSLSYWAPEKMTALVTGRPSQGRKRPLRGLWTPVRAN